jgi:hypothetical protein
VKKILFCGDSTMVGRTRKPGIADLVVSEFNEPKVCNDLLVAKYGAGAVTIINAGIGGTNCIQWCNGDPSFAMPSMSARMLLPENADVDIVVVQIGINDAFNGSVTIDAFNWCLQEMWRIVVKVHGKKIIFCTPSPIDNAAGPRLWTMQNGMKQVAAACGVQVVDHYASLLSVAAGWTILLSDNTHPTDELYAFKGHAMFLALIPHFK